MTRGGLSAVTTACATCPLRELEIFRDRDQNEITFIQDFKSGEKKIAAGESLFQEKDMSEHLYTVLSGWMFRYRTIDGTRRQIINYGLPGDFLGLQATLGDAMSHGAEALTDVRICTFERERLWTLYKEYPRLAYDMTWLAAQHERSFEEHLLTLGQRTAFERIAYLLWHLYDRGREIGLIVDNSLMIPLRQQHIADTLGLSLVHTNKTLQKIREDGVIDIQDRSLRINDEARLIRMGRIDASLSRARPLI